jgi:hypothetical protein
VPKQLKWHVKTEVAIFKNTTEVAVLEKTQLK